MKTEFTNPDCSVPHVIAALLHCALQSTDKFHAILRRADDANIFVVSSDSWLADGGNNTHLFQLSPWTHQNNVVAIEMAIREAAENLAASLPEHFDEAKLANFKEQFRGEQRTLVQQLNHELDRRPSPDDKTIAEQEIVKLAVATQAARAAFWSRRAIELFFQK